MDRHNFLLLITLLGACISFNSFDRVSSRPFFYQQAAEANSNSFGLPSGARNSTSASIVEEKDGDFLVLNDNEVIQNTDILRHLARANKEEVEEIVGQSPALQNALLNKVQSAINSREAKRKAGKLNSDEDHNQIMIINGDDVDDDADYIENNNNNNNKAKNKDNGKNKDKNSAKDKKIDALKNKFKSKVFKISSSLKQKLMSLKEKKKVGGKWGASGGGDNDGHDYKGEGEGEGEGDGDGDRDLSRDGARDRDRVRGGGKPSSAWPHLRYSVSTN